MKYIKKEDKKVEPVDFFYETKYTAHTATNIKKLYESVSFICLDCKLNKVETKMDVYNQEPTFIILRKHFCLQCWLKHVYVSHQSSSL